jgi:hypothetical protein
MASRRVLKLTFEFHVPEGLEANIRSAKIESATDQMIGAIQGMTPQVFPWASELVAHREWSYRWLEMEPRVFEVPATDKNTVKSTSDALDEDDASPLQEQP